MSEELKQVLIEIKKLKEEMRELKGISENTLPTYSFSNITHKILKELVTIKKNLDDTIFDKWFLNNISIKEETTQLFKDLIEDNYRLIDSYNEEDLKVNFIIPILNKVHFKSYENEFRDFYELPLKYETEKFIFNGTTDFLVSKGLIDSEKPYFFIQEFKKGQQKAYPESQLLAELIAGVELNDWKMIKGAYIVGAIWRFVILEKLDTDKYQYFVSKNFDATRVDDLETIYKNLLFIKQEIIEKIEAGE